MLSMISPICRPLGFLTPFVLEGRRILQSICNQNLPWDIKLNDDVKKEWTKFITRLKHVDELYNRRCIRPDDFCKILDISTPHHFCDASQQGYGQCRYIRMVDKEGEFSVVCYWECSPKNVCLISKTRTNCSCLISKKNMFIEERIESWRGYPLFLDR